MYISSKPWKVLKIAGLGEKVLKQTCSHIKDPTADEIQDFAMNAMFTCLQNNAFGLSAPQLYRPIRLFVTRDYKGISDPSSLRIEEHLQLPLKPYFNPKIEMKSHRMTGEFEACLSDPWNVAFVARPQTIGISYVDGYGKYKEEELTGWHAQVFQHEYDHLEGKTLGEMCTQRGLYMSKPQYAKCEANWKKTKSLPELSSLIKASLLIKDGGYWGPEAENSIQPDDINMDAFIEQMILFLKEEGVEVDRKKTSLPSLIEQVMKYIKKDANGSKTSPSSSSPTETLIECSVSL